MITTFEGILKITEEIAYNVQRAGHRLDRCVWEFHPLVFMVMHDANVHSKPDANLNVRATLRGIPVRVDSRVDGITLKMVNLRMWD